MNTSHGAYPEAAALIHDAGDTTTLAHYLELLSMAGLVSGLQKFSANTLRKRFSIPKLQVRNTALMTSSLGESFGAIEKVPPRTRRG